MFDVVSETRKAEERLRGLIRTTPLEHSPRLSRAGIGKVYLKLENTQITGSFKLRGALNKLLSLTEEEKASGIVTASSGNHAMAIAYGLKTLDIQGRIFLPANASPAKINALREYSAEIELFGDDCVETEIHARQLAAAEGCIYISPYNDPQIIGGQGTVATEIIQQIRQLDTLFIPVGGGGLAAGNAGYLKALFPHIRVIGCQPENSPVMSASVKAGRVIQMESLPTISEGSAGGIEVGTITLPLCRDNVDEFILVSEEEIKGAIRLIFDSHFMLIEGAAALSVAAFLKEQIRFEDKTNVLIISGGKLSRKALRDVFCSDSGEEQ